MMVRSIHLSMPSNIQYAITMSGFFIASLAWSTNGERGVAVMPGLTFQGIIKVTCGRLDILLLVDQVQALMDVLCLFLLLC